MATFIDAKERPWELRLDAPTIMRIRQDCDPRFLLNDSPEDDTLLRMQRDPVLLCRVILLMCDKDRQQRDVSEEDFYLGVIGDAIDRATEAMLEAITFFIPRAKRELMLAGVARQQAMQEKIIALTKSKLQDPKMEEAVLRQVEEIIDASLGVHVTPPTNATSSQE